MELGRTGLHGDPFALSSLERVRLGRSGTNAPDSMGLRYLQMTGFNVCLLILHSNYVGQGCAHARPIAQYIERTG